MPPKTAGVVVIAGRLALVVQQLGEGGNTSGYVEGGDGARGGPQKTVGTAAGDVITGRLALVVQREDDGGITSGYVDGGDGARGVPQETVIAAGVLVIAGRLALVVQRLDDGKITSGYVEGGNRARGGPQETVIAAGVDVTAGRFALVVQRLDGGGITSGYVENGEGARGGPQEARAPGPGWGLAQDHHQESQGDHVPQDAAPPPPPRAEVTGPGVSPLREGPRGNVRVHEDLSFPDRDVSSVSVEDAGWVAWPPCCPMGGHQRSRRGTPASKNRDPLLPVP